MSRPSIRAEQLIDAIRSAGTIRSGELSTITGITPNNIGTLLAQAIAARTVVVCKISQPGRRSCNEYRIGSGVPDTFRPLTIKRSDIGTASHRGGTTPRVPLSEPINPGAASATPTFLKPQPAVGNTGSSRPDSSDTPAGARTVAADQATPKPAARTRLKKEPAATKASAGDATSALDIRIEHDGTITIGTVESVIELDPKQARKLGHFMGATHGVWNPL